MFDTPHPAHKPPATDRLAPIEARGVVTDAIGFPSTSEAISGWCYPTEYLRKIADEVQKDWERPSMETVQGVLLAAASLRARESAPAVEFPDLDWGMN